MEKKTMETILCVYDVCVFMYMHVYIYMYMCAYMYI